MTHSGRETALGNRALRALQGPFLGVWGPRVLLDSQNVTLSSTVTYFHWKVPACVADVICGLLCAFPAGQAGYHDSHLSFHPNRGSSALCWTQLSLWSLWGCSNPYALGTGLLQSYV